MSEQIKVKIKDDKTILVEGVEYRKHWFIHHNVTENGPGEYYSLTHKNTGKNVKTEYAAQPLKKLVDFIVDDIGVDGSFKDISELTYDEKSKIAYARTQMDFTEYMGSIQV